MRLYTEGTFEIFHWGHANFLRQCKGIVGKDGEVIVGVNDDEFTTMFKGKPVMNLEERIKSVLQCKYVDRVYAAVHDGYDSKPQFLEIKPDILAVGTEWLTNGKDIFKQYGVDQRWLDDHGIVLVYLPRTEGISTTDIKSRIRGDKDE